MGITNKVTVDLTISEIRHVTSYMYCIIYSCHLPRMMWRCESILLSFASHDVQKYELYIRCLDAILLDCEKDSDLFSFRMYYQLQLELSEPLPKIVGYD